MRFNPRAIPVVLLTFLLVLGTSGAADWYVDGNSVAGSPDGSPGSPYLNINDALNDPGFASGDTIFVAPATYSENVLVDSKAAHLFGTGGPTVTVIQGNGAGSAVNLYDAGSSTLSGFTVTGGEAQFGGGIEVFMGSPTITNNIITGNSAVADITDPSFGGGVDTYQASGVVIVGNLVVGNHADGRGAGIQLESSYGVEVSFNTVVANTLGVGNAAFGSGIALYNSTGSVRNNIVAGNTANVTAGRNAGGIELLLDSSALEGNLLFQNLPEDYVIDEVTQALPAGVGNFSGDPRFVDSGSLDYRLLADSAAIDAAVVGVTPPSTDFDGNPIPVDGDGTGGAIADRGCYEHLGSLGGLTISVANVVSWGAAFMVPDGYHVYRGTPAGLAGGDAGVCQDGRDGNLLDTMFSEPDDPAFGDVFTFLAGFERAGADSGLGRASSGSARVPAVACP